VADANAPFTVTVVIGEDGTARTVAGPDAAQIKYGGIVNTMQLIAVDDTKTIVGFDEKRRLNKDETSAELSIAALPRGKTYAFLLLMGHWDRNYAQSGGNYAYDPGKSPTLLAAGFQGGVSLTRNETQVALTAYPLWVETAFTTGTGAEKKTIEPAITGGKPGPAYMSPGSWTVKWTV
jgi:hypothetical protein